MSKLWRRRRRRPKGWTRTATAASDRQIVVKHPGPLGARLARTDHLSGGFAVEASVLARLLGVRLLTLEGVVFVSPAEIQDAVSRTSTPALTEALPVNGDGGDKPLSRELSEATSDVREDGPAGQQLEAAARLLAECSTELRRLGRP